MKIHHSLTGPVLIFSDVGPGVSSNIEVRLSKDDIAEISRPILLAILNNGTDEQRKTLLDLVKEIHEVYHEGDPSE